MPVRPLDRQQAWLLPPTLGDLIPNDHPARFVAEFVDGLDDATWVELGIDPNGDPLGTPAYHPRALLGVWLHGFMTGIRSSRKLEAACRDQISYLWLTGWQRPDHNTLWRFYQAHRQAMRRLLKYTVVTAMEMKLVDLAVQAVDGTKITANAAGDRTYDAAGLSRLLERAEAAIIQLEAQNESSTDPVPPRLPEELQEAKALRQRVREAMNHLLEHEELSKVNLTDKDAQLMKGRSGITIGYNAQAVVSPLAPGVTRGGTLITGVQVVNKASDFDQLVPMLENAEETTGNRTQVTLADGGYHTAANLEAAERRDQVLVMAERYQGKLKDPFFKDQFKYDSITDSYICPHGQRLPFRSLRKSPITGLWSIRLYRASRTACRTCSAFGICTRDAHTGRALWIGSSDMLLRKHRQWMTTAEARQLYARRKELSEPTFGIIKDQLRMRQFLLRGLANVQAEFSLIATAFNLRVICEVWKRARAAVQAKMKSVLSGDSRPELRRCPDFH